MLQKCISQLNLLGFFTLVAIVLLCQPNPKNIVQGAIDPEAFRCRNITRNEIVSKSLQLEIFLLRKDNFMEPKFFPSQSLSIVIQKLHE